jgi:hypothetical protein
MGAQPLAIISILLSPPFLHLLRNSNFDWLVVIGFILPPSIGLFFVLVKPQIGIGIAIYWLFLHWKKKGVCGVILVFSPVTLAFILSFAIYGFWLPLMFKSHGMETKWNLSLWPYSILIGSALIFILSLEISSRQLC